MATSGTLENRPSRAAKRPRYEAVIELPPLPPEQYEALKGSIALAADERGGTTPYNLIPMANGAQPGGAEHHPAATPYDLAAWWCRYILPPGGVLLDAFCGSGGVLVAGLDEGASRVIGIDKEAKYLETARRRIRST
jgi:DNA modification methylase